MNEKQVFTINQFAKIDFFQLIQKRINHITIDIYTNLKCFFVPH